MACILSCKVAGTAPFPEEAEIRVDIPVREVTDLIIFGRITECNTGEPITGAIVKAFVCRGGVEVGLSHSFSGCNGEYLLNIPLNLINGAKKVMVKASCTDHPPVVCSTGCDEGCACPTPA